MRNGRGAVLRIGVWIEEGGGVSAMASSRPELRRSSSMACWIPRAVSSLGDALSNSVYTRGVAVGEL